MAKVNKISSFKSFTEIRKQESVSKLREENNVKRQESVGKIAAILDELGLTSFEGLEEDQKESIISKIFGDVSEEEIAEIEVEVEEVSASEEVTESDEPKCTNKKGHLYKQIDKDGTVECVQCGLRNSLSESVVTEGNQPHKEIEKAIKGMKGVSMDIKGDTIIVSNKAGDEFIYSMNDADDVADFITTIEESVVNEKVKETTEAEGRNWKVGTLDHPKFGKITTFQFMTNDKVYIYLSTKQSLEDQDNFIITAGGGAYNTAWSLNDKDVKKMAKDLQELSLRLQNERFMNLGKSGEGKYKGKEVKLKDYVDALEAWVELRDSLLSESVVTEKATFKVGDTTENSIGSEVEIIAIDNWRNISKQFKKEMGSDADSYGYEDTAKGDYYLARIVKSEEGDEGDLGIFPVEYDHANYWGLGESLMNEALDIKYKRDAKKVLTQYNKIFAELGSLTADKISHLGAIKYIYAEALTDANFHRERTATEKIIKGRLGSVTVNPLTLGKKAIIVGAKKISQILDEFYSRISNAAGWSGIGVAEGTALYLESIGESKLAEKLLAGFNAVEESVKFQLTEEEISLKESKFNEVINYVINEGTRGQFGKIDNRGNITSVYTHYDSYPENMLPIIKKSFKGGKNVDTILSKGANSGLDSDISKINFYGDGSAASHGSIKRIDKYLQDAADDGGAEYVYLWDEGSKKWMMADIYKETGLIPAFESKIYEGLTTSLDEFTTDTKSYSGAIAYSFKNHKNNFKENIKVSTALGDKFKITNEKGGIVMQRSHGSEFDTVWLSADKKEAQKVADWLKSEGAEIVLFGPKTRSFTGSKQEFIDRYL